MNTFYVRILCVGYLLLATLLFLGNWFYLKYALVFIIGHILYFALYSTRNAERLETVVSKKSLVSLAVLALVWTLLMGVGGVFLQTTDFIAHNTKFYELFLHKWPILIKERQSFSCYYYGYYLVPALLSKIFGDLSVVTIIIYTWLGIWLGLIWIYLLLFRKLWLVVLLIMSGGIIFSFELASLALLHASISYNPLLSLFIQSLYVPNQVVAALITTGLFLYYIKDYSISFYAITLSFFWGVFTAFLLILLFGIVLVIDYLRGRNKISLKSFLINYVLPSILFLPTFLFLTSSNAMPVNEFYDFDSFSKMIPFLDMFVLAFVTIWLMPVQNARPGQFLFTPILVFTALVLLCILLTYKIGIYNDLYFRGSIPLYLILMVNILQKLFIKFQNDKSLPLPTSPIKISLHPLRKYAVVLIWLATALLASVFQLSQSLRKNLVADTYKSIPYKTFPNSYQALLKHYGQSGADQYVGNPKSFYFLYLAPIGNEIKLTRNR